jgi:hypothetical protein
VTCDFASANGHFPGKVVHCDECHRSWTGLAECHCSDCHRHFSGDSAFQAHREHGECRDPSILKDKNDKPRFKPIQRKDGFVWVRNVDFGGIPGAPSQDVSKRPNKKVAPTEPKESAVA